MSASRPEFQTPSLIGQLVALLRSMCSRALASRGGASMLSWRLKAPATPVERAGDPARPFPEKRFDRGSLVTAAGAAGLLLSIPLSTAIGARLLAEANERQSEIIARAAASRVAAAREAAAIERARPEAARLLGRRTVSELVERFARALPPDARIHALSREESGAIVAEIEIMDPDLLRPALASDPLLKSLRAIGQRGVPDGGIRVSMRSERL